MLISPLMGPIIGFGFGLALFDFAEIRRSLLSLAVGASLAVLFCALIVLHFAACRPSPARSRRAPVPICSISASRSSPGLAGTYAMIRGRHGAIVGVAIAVALMPPLAVMGFGLATWNLPILGGSTFLFLTNLMAIGISAAVLARLYGFGQRLSPRQTGMQALLIVGTLLAFAVPLGLALRQIAWETLATRQAREAVTERFGEDAGSASSRSISTRGRSGFAPSSSRRLCATARRPKPRATWRSRSAGRSRSASSRSGSGRPTPRRRSWRRRGARRPTGPRTGSSSGWRWSRAFRPSAS